MNRATPYPLGASRRRSHLTWLAIALVFAACAPDQALPASTTDLEVIQAGVTALYSGDAERAIELFELPDGDDDQIRREAAYQAAIGGRLTLNCVESTDGVFSCNTPYHNALTDAIDFVDSPGDVSSVRLQDGVIRTFSFPEHGFLLATVEGFLADQQVDGYEDCVVADGSRLRTPECANLIMAHLDEWAAWCGRIVTVQPFASRCDT